MTDSIRSAASHFNLDVEPWRAFFAQNVKSHERLVRGYLAFLSELQERNLPPIFEGQHLAQLLGTPPAVFARLTYDPDSCYRTFEIPKRSGGSRSISTPWPALLNTQQWIDWFILRRLPIHEAAFGYVPGKSNVSNASIHVGAKVVLCVDIANFFESIGFQKVIQTFFGLGYPHNVSFLLAKLCTRFGSLPQGAASSPQMSNVVMYDVDAELSKRCAARGYTYSRYVDDITVSGNEISDEFVREIRNVISKMALSLNDGKTRLQKGRKKIVTGISIGSGRMKLPRPMRRKFKNDAFLALKHLSNDDRSIVLEDPLRLDRQLGQLAYWQSVEPDNDAVRSLLTNLRSEMRRLSHKMPSVPLISPE